MGSIESEINIDQFRLPTGTPLPTTSQPRKPSRRKATELFLKGPISMAWLRAAARLPGKALCVGVELWFQSGLKKSREAAINLSRFEGVSRSAASRGLEALEEAGLVTATRHPGRKPIVRILEPTIGEDEAQHKGRRPSLLTVH